jgi:hypothetical protein
VTALLDALAFSGVWVALAAVALIAASASVFGVARSPALVGFAFTGTFCIYAVDRLRDLSSDRLTAPRRSEFIARYRALLAAACAVAAAVAGVYGVRLGAVAFVVAAVAGGFGFFHRRLKHVAFLKGLYVAASWVAVTVVLPALLARPRPAATAVAWSIAIVGSALLANSIATSARDQEAAARILGAHGALRVARIIALAGTFVGLAAPAALHSLAAIPLATAVALVSGRAGDRYELVLDGALIAGGFWTLL